MDLDLLQALGAHAAIENALMALRPLGWALAEARTD
jgi:hypothetical protein